MILFKSYTGSAMLNNALHTIEALAKQPIDTIDTNRLLELFEDPYGDGLHTLTRLNKRMKSYTMLFTKNGPLLHNKDYGEAIYNDLITGILTSPEVEGPNVCELSGLRFKTTFASFYEQTLRKVKYPTDKIKGKDKTVNRCWFPLLGGLGSDAQALPQAKYALSVHPVCLAIMQFLPLSTVLYKGGVLLIDASNHEFAGQLIKSNVERIKSRIATSTANLPVDNIKDLTKGHYLLQALTILSSKEREDVNTAFNLWSFTNSGTGASCEIDRIPSTFINKLRSLYRSPSLLPTLQTILCNSRIQNDFLDSLEGNRDFYGLYPSKNHDGVPIRFFEAYQRLIGNGGHVVYAKYIARLLNKVQWSAVQAKFLNKSDAPASDYSLYKSMVFEALVAAAVRKEWHWCHHLAVLNDPTKIPLDGSISHLYRMIHFYYSVLSADDEVETPPVPDLSHTPAGQLVNLFFHLIGEDKRNYAIRWLDSRYQQVGLTPLLIREGSRFYEFKAIYPLLYDAENRQNIYGLRDLLRIYLNYYRNEKQPVWEVQPVDLFPKPTPEQGEYLDKLHHFCEEYTAYYRDGRGKGTFDEVKFRKHVLTPMRSERFQIAKWLEEVCENMSNTEQANGESFAPTFQTDQLLYDYTGRYNPLFARFAIEYNLNRFYFQSTTVKQ